MKVSGFTFIRNAIQYDYPIVESIRSMLPVCDEVIVCVGNSSDDTASLIQKIGDPRIRIVHTVWNDALKKGGAVLADETNKAFAEVAADSDWCFYLQGDELLHEDYVPTLLDPMRQYKDQKEVEGLLFPYKHFYGSYDYVGDSRKWYSHEIRVIRNDKSIYSYRDAQGFRKEGRKLRVKRTGAWIYHYGWVRHPHHQLQKSVGFEQLYSDDSVSKMISEKDLTEFDYSGIDSLSLFKGTHPAVMKERIARKNWQFEFDITRKNFTLKGYLLHLIEKLTGKRLFNYRNYRLIR